MSTRKTFGDYMRQIRAEETWGSTRNDAYLEPFVLLDRLRMSFPQGRIPADAILSCAQLQLWIKDRWPIWHANPMSCDDDGNRRTLKGAVVMSHLWAAYCTWADEAEAES